MVRASPTPGKIFGALIEEVRFAADSLLAQAGFELFVPLGISASTSWWSRGLLVIALAEDMNLPG